MMNEEIGNAAGQVWRALHEKGELSLPQLKKTTHLSAPLLDWALGWLAREEKLVIVRDPAKRGSLHVRLK